MVRFESVEINRPYEQIVDQIEDGIRSGRLVDGQKLPTERELGQQFGVSRGVVREAIKVLDTLGLVESRQGSGIFVRKNSVLTVSRALTFVGRPDESSIQSLFEFRCDLECLAVRLATIRRTDAEAAEIRSAAEVTAEAAAAANVKLFGVGDSDFHRLIREASRNPFLATTLEATRDMQTDVIRIFAAIVGSIEVAAQHHLTIAESIEQRNPELAESHMRDHIVYTAERVAEKVPVPIDARP